MWLSELTPGSQNPHSSVNYIQDDTVYFKARFWRLNSRILESNLGATDFHIGQILKDILAVKKVVVAGSEFRFEIAAVQNVIVAGL